MTKGPDAFRTISEVAEELNVPQHVLRFWETRFSQIRPLKRSGGRRFYRPDDVALLRGIRYLLYGAGYTIRGVQRILKEEGIAHVQRISLQADSGVGGVPPAEGPGLDGETDDAGFHDAAHDGAAEAGAGTDEPSDDRSDDPGIWASPAFGSDRETAGASPADASNGIAAARDAAGFADIPHAAEDDAGTDLPTSGTAAGPSAETSPAAQAIALSGVDPIISRYAPGPLSARADRAASPRADTADDRIIQSRYHLTTDTREHLQAALDEIRECRRLLNSALNRLQD